MSLFRDAAEGVVLARSKNKEQTDSLPPASFERQSTNNYHLTHWLKERCLQVVCYQIAGLPFVERISPHFVEHITTDVVRGSLRFIAAAGMMRRWLTWKPRRY